MTNRDYELRKMITTAMKDILQNTTLNVAVKNIDNANVAGQETLAKQIKNILFETESQEDALIRIAYELEKYLSEPVAVRCLHSKNRDK